EAQLDAVVHQPDLVHARPDLCGVEQIDRALLEHARADPPLDVRPAAPLQDHRLDAVQVQKLREQEPRRPRPHDANLRAHHCGLLVARPCAAGLNYAGCYRVFIPEPMTNSSSVSNAASVSKRLMCSPTSRQAAAWAG